MKNKIIISKEIREIANKIWALEQECQEGKNISKNLKEMENLTNKLTFQDILLIADILEAKG